MVKEGTPGKYQLRAVEPGSRRPLMGRADAHERPGCGATCQARASRIHGNRDGRMETVPEGWERASKPRW